MAGFDWDYSGTVLSWDKGTLTRDLGQFDPQEGVEHGRVVLRLNCDTASTQPLTKEEGMQVAGDRDFSSDHPALQKMNPCVSEMVGVFPEKTKKSAAPTNGTEITDICRFDSRAKLKSDPRLVSGPAGTQKAYGAPNLQWNKRDSPQRRHARAGS
jgi:hypothetical protein